MNISIWYARKILPPLAAGLLFAGAAGAAVDAQLAPGNANDTTADAVFGQLDFVFEARNFLDKSGLNLATGTRGDIAIDKSVSPNRVYAADRNNNRVLGWNNIAAFAKHSPATIVIGQPTMSSNVCNNGGITAAGLCSPAGVAVDSGGNLYIADTGNHRVLFYNTPFSKGRVADEVFGQYGSYTTNTANIFGLSEDSLSSPLRIALDAADNLYIADQGNNRVLEFHTPQTITAVAGSGDATADKVFGQFGSFGTGICNSIGIGPQSLCAPAGLGLDSGGNLYVADSNNNRVLKFNKPLASDTSADKVYGQLGDFTTNTCNVAAKISSETLCRPAGVAVDPDGALYVSDQGNHRVLAFPPAGTAANKVLGQFSSDLTGSLAGNVCNNTGANVLPPVNSRSLCSPDGIAFDSSVSGSPRLYVSDTANNRILQYKPSGLPAVLKSAQAAGGVLGQPLLTTKFVDFLDGRGFNLQDVAEGGVAIDYSVTPNRIYVSDRNNNRVLAWNDVAAFKKRMPAAKVFGQPNAFSNLANNGGISEAALNQPRALAVDAAGNLYVADQGNHRVLVYNAPFSSDSVADGVFGQAGNFTTNTCNQGGISADSLCTPGGLAFDAGGNLYISDFSNNRVLKYNAPFIDTTADGVYGQADSFTSGTANLGGLTANSLSGPRGLAFDGDGNLFVADAGNNRVLAFNKTSADTAADKVFGQVDKFTTNGCNLVALNAESLCSPRFVAINSANTVFIADSGNNRVLKFNSPLSTDRSADAVFGQGNRFNTSSCKTLGPDSLCGPDGIAIDAADNLYVADTIRNRVLEYLQP